VLEKRNIAEKQQQFFANSATNQTLWSAAQKQVSSII
jgi:hypothetical protein